MKTFNFRKILITLLFILVTITINAHTPGPYYIYKCPKCEHLLKKGSNNSGNTFGSVLYSDGKMIAPMLPEFPNLTKCKKCDSIFWLKDLKEIGTCDSWDSKCKPEWKNADNVEFLNIEDLVKALDLDSAKIKDREIFVRQRIWWEFNDRLREKGEIFINENDENLWTRNCQRLIELFDTTDINQKIMTAELYRNMEDFDKCMSLINTIDKNDFDWLIQKFKTECDNKNRWLIQLR